MPIWKYSRNIRSQVDRLWHRFVDCISWILRKKLLLLLFLVLKVAKHSTTSFCTFRNLQVGIYLQLLLFLLVTCKYVVLFYDQMSIDNFQTCLSKANAVPQYIIWETYSPCTSTSKTCSPKCLKVYIANIGRRIVFAVEKTFHGITKVGNFAFWIGLFPSFQNGMNHFGKKSHSEERKILRKIDWQPNLSKEYYFVFPCFVNEANQESRSFDISSLICFAFSHMKKNQKDIFRKWQKVFLKTDQYHRHHQVVRNHHLLS